MVSDSVTQYVIVLKDDQKFLKLLELVGLFQDNGSIIVFVEKQVTADVLLKVRSLFTRSSTRSFLCFVISMFSLV